MEQAGYDFTWGAIKALGLAFVVIVAATAVLNATLRYFRVGYDETDNRATGERSNLKVYTDHATGCQYIATSSGTLTPRLDAEGQPICGAKP